MNHIPGPWKIADDIFQRRLEILSAEGIRIAVCTVDYPMTTKTLGFNATLIKAAPEMLEMLEEIQECAAYWSEYDVPLGIVDRLNETIKKAKTSRVGEFDHEKN